MEYGEFSASEQGRNEMEFGSLFSGIGGMDLGLERAGFKCKWQVEYDAYATKVLSKHWPNVRRHDDVRTFPPDGDDFDWRVDLIVGGDPCQENSNSQRNGDCRSPSLGGEFIRILDLLRPFYFLRENPAVVKKSAPWPWWRFRQEAERLNYAVLPFRLRACCVGADFRRERLFLLGELQGTERTRLERHVCEVMAGACEGRQDADSSGSNRWSATPRICGRAVRIPNRMERLKGIGNAVVPQVAEWIGKRILEASRHD